MHPPDSAPCCTLTPAAALFEFVRRFRSFGTEISVGMHSAHCTAHGAMSHRTAHALVSNVECRSDATLDSVSTQCGPATNERQADSETDVVQHGARPTQRWLLCCRDNRQSMATKKKQVQRHADRIAARILSASTHAVASTTETALLFTARCHCAPRTERSDERRREIWPIGNVGAPAPLLNSGVCVSSCSQSLSFTPPLHHCLLDKLRRTPSPPAHRAAVAVLIISFIRASCSRSMHRHHRARRVATE